MITISLDEQGVFERGHEREYPCLLIGGLIYHCEPQDLDDEIKRIQDMLKRVCIRNGGSYPKDLHDNKGSYVGRKVMQELHSNLPSFLLGQGAWAARPPKGRYSMYAMVGDRQGIGLTRKGISNLINDDVAGNRYEHMVYRTVRNLLFQDFGIEDTTFRLDLATRVGAIDSWQIEYDTEKLGASTKEKQDGKNLFYVTDPTSFRAMLSQAMLDNPKQDVDVTLNVVSINYKSDNGEQVFLYLADVVCSFFYSVLKNSASIYIAMPAIEKILREKMNGGSYHLWAYHDVDVQYERILKDYRADRYFEALYAIQTIRQQTDPLSQTYDRLWLGTLQNKIAESCKPRELELAFEKLIDYLEDPSYRIRSAKEILDVLMRQSEHLDIGRYPRLAMKIYRTQMTVMNHFGYYDKTLAIYDQCLPLMSLADVEDILEINNVRCVALQDKLMFAEALEAARKNVTYEEKLVGIRREMSPDESVYWHYGRSLSQLGQCYAFTGEYEQALDCFRKALACFGNNRVDAQKTRSYYLHALVEAGKQQEYEKEAEIYFGAAGLKNQLREIEEIEETSRKFALYIFVKAVYTFYADNMKDKEKFIDEIKRMYRRSNDNHPWELILKYCALILLTTPGGSQPGKNKQNTNRIADNKMKTRAAELMQLAGESVEEIQDGIIPQIVLDGQKQYLRAKNGEKNVFTKESLPYLYR